MMKFWNIFLQELGFESSQQLTKQVFGANTLLFVIAQISASVLSVAIAFVKDWIWDPPSGAVIFALLVIIESISGMLVAVRVKKERFDFQKFYNIAPKMIAHILLLSMSYNLGKHSILLIWLPNACFGWFASRNFLTIVLNTIELKWVRGDFAEFLFAQFKVHNKDFSHK